MLSITSKPLQAKQLIRSTTSTFCIGWEMRYDKNGCSVGQVVIGSFITKTWCPSSCITSHAEFFCKTLNHPSDSAPLQPRFGTLQLLAFPKTTITFEREEISDCRWDSGKYTGAADGEWENCVRCQGAYFEGDWETLSCVQCFLYLVSSSINVSNFHITCLDVFWICLLYTSDAADEHRDV